MSVRRHECITVACDVCRWAFKDGGATVHFADLAEAGAELRRDGWALGDDGRVVCPKPSAAHQTARDALDSGAQR